MITASKFTRLAGLVIIVLTIGVAAIGFLVVREDVDEMHESARENILWDAMQVEIELTRFQHELVKFSTGSGGATPRSINERFDILWSRVTLFGQGTVGARLRAYDSGGIVLSKLLVKMKAVEASVVGLTPQDQARAQSLFGQFNQFKPDLRRLSLKVLHGEEANRAILRENLSQSSLLLTISSVVAAVVSLLLIVVFAREARRFRQLAHINETLLHASDKASRAKSQFLAMMSHELRTPMNGVLGLLALLRQQGLSSRQARLLAQAERSGQRMIGLLSDILDFSDLRDDRLKLNMKPFETARLIGAIREDFDVVAQREGVSFVARIDASCPPRVIGDFARLRQALTHLVTYLMETAGISNIAVDVAYAKGCLNASISFDYGRDGGEWVPDLIMGSTAPDARSGATDSLASEALGPAVSRGLIAAMGGVTTLNNVGHDRIVVLVSVPAKEMAAGVLLIRIICKSRALETICKAALRLENVSFLPPGSRDTAHVIIIEAGGIDEADTVASCAQLCPGAMLVALGRPRNPEKFDDIVEVPIDIAAIRRAGFMQLAHARTFLAGNEKVQYANGTDAT